MKIREYAEAGVEEAVIFEACGLDEAQLKAAGEFDAVRAAIAKGHAVCRAELVVEIKRRGQRSTKNAGSVNAQALRARNLLGWDRQSIDVEEKPDLSTAKERLKDELTKLAINKSQVVGRPVTPADLLFQDAAGRWPWEAEPPASSSEPAR